jgi:hypothetical protein
MLFDFLSPRSFKRRAERRTRRRIYCVIQGVRKSRMLAEEIGQKDAALLLMMAEHNLVAAHDEGLRPLGAIPHQAMRRLGRQQPLSSEAVAEAMTPRDVDTRSRAGP